MRLGGLYFAAAASAVARSAFDKQVRVIGALAEGCSIRATERLSQVLAAPPGRRGALHRALELCPMPCGAAGAASCGPGGGAVGDLVEAALSIAAAHP